MPINLYSRNDLAAKVHATLSPSWRKIRSARHPHRLPDLAAFETLPHSAPPPCNSKAMQSNGGASRAGVTWHAARYAPAPFLLSVYHRLRSTGSLLDRS